MSAADADDDDLSILEEINALEGILAQKPQTSSNAHRTSLTYHNLEPRMPDVSSQGFNELSPRELSPHELFPREVSPSEISRSPQLMYEKNLKLISHLQQAKQELLNILETIKEDKALLDEKIRSQASYKRTQFQLSSARMPYFKDVKLYPAPPNEDTIAKAKNGELMVVRLRAARPWTAKDRNILWRAICRERSATVLNKERARSDVPNSTLNLPKNFQDMVQPSAMHDFDWLKIAVMDFDEQHTAQECQVMWQVFLHPDINRYQWTRDEDVKLNQLSNKYGRQNWEAIAKELGTRRSGYQCFIRYNTKHESINATESAWTEAEDTRLRECVDRFKIGKYVPWGNVARYIPGRIKVQVYYRWTYNVAPHLKKGRFSQEEDETLIAAVAKYGTNFSMISHRIMPHRTTVQLSAHYQHIEHHEMGFKTSWSINEDTELLNLQKIHGTDWSTIAKSLPGRTRTHVRQRYNSILRSARRGITLYDIPRPPEAVKNPRVAIQPENTSELDDIDLKLVKYFQPTPPSVKPGRKHKFYRDKELADKTRNASIAFKELDVHLEVPEDIEDMNLTEKDKQLLNSLRDFYESLVRVESPRMEATRLEFQVADCLHIDYEPPGKVNHSAIELEMELYTPDLVVEMIGEDLNKEFDHLARIMVSPLRSSNQSRNVDVPFIKIMEAFMKKTKNREDVSQDAESHENRPIVETVVEKTKKRKDSGNNNPWYASICNGIISEETSPTSINYIEPCYHTLLAFRNILSFQSNSPSLPEDSMSDEGKVAMQLLKKRLLQLFKYPIGMSHVVRPEVDTRDVQHAATADAVDEDEKKKKKKKVSSSKSTPPTKRKRKEEI